MTDPHENTVQDVLENLPFQHLMNIWPHTAPVFNSIRTESITDRVRVVSNVDHVAENNRGQLEGTIEGGRDNLDQTS